MKESNFIYSGLEIGIVYKKETLKESIQISGQTFLGGEWGKRSMQICDELAFL